MLAIRNTTDTDLPDIISVVRAAFVCEIEADLTRNLLADPTAQPALSLLATDDGRAVGHILFTKVRLIGPQEPPKASLLAPLSVAPESQGQGIGGRLIKEGIERLRESGTGLVFVLGHPSYYPRHGFVAASPFGFTAPYPIAEEHSDAWMVQALQPNIIGRCQGKVACADALDKPEYWQE